MYKDKMRMEIKGGKYWPLMEKSISHRPIYNIKKYI